MADLYGEESESAPACETGNEYDGQMGLRIAAIFVIWITSTIGACFPVYAERHRELRVPGWSFFFAKYFGSGVIVATAFIHLLAPAHMALSNECLTGPIVEYPWVEGNMMMTIFVLFFIELMVMRYSRFGNGDNGHGQSHEHGPGQSGGDGLECGKQYAPSEGHHSNKTSQQDPLVATESICLDGPRNSHVPGQDHLGHSRDHKDEMGKYKHAGENDFVSQLTAIFILEFGIIFHSIFIGLTLAVAGEEFKTLFIVLVFHQTFEGLGLGSRVAEISWPPGKKMTPYILGVAYGLSTPIAIAVGLGVRESYPPGSATTLIVNGIFDSISAGILIYTGLVELMAHEFLFSNAMRKGSLKTVLYAFGMMCLGAGVMAVLGKWA